MAEPLIELDAGRDHSKVRLRLAPKSVKEGSGLLELALTGNARRVGDTISLWIGPDQWLLISEHLSAAELIERCRRTLTSLSHHAVDVSAALACARLRGRLARGLLAMGTSIDCGTDGLGVSECRTVRFARIPATLHAIESESFDLYYDRSYQHYLQQWFSHALRDPLFEKKACLSTS
jgi:heterotetrameric sarcosine oxidase gamma subunit